MTRTVDGSTTRLAARPSSHLRATPLDNLMYLVRRLHDGQCRCVVTLDGRVDARRLAHAARLSLDAVPLLACAYVPRPLRPRWERPPEGRLEPVFQEVETDDPDLALRSFLAAPLDPLRAPQVAIRLIRGTSDVICCKLSHMAVDAGGMLGYVRLLCSLYRRLGEDAAYRPSTVAPPPGLGRVLRRAGALAVVRGCLRFRYPASPWGFPSTGDDYSGGAFPIRTLPPERLAAISTYARARRLSVGDVLLTAFFRALVTLLSPPAGAPLPVQQTVDLRRYLPADETAAICDLAGVAYPTIRHRPGESFDETLAAVSRINARQRADHPWLGGALLLQLCDLLPSAWRRAILEGAIRRTRPGTAHPFFANLGVIDPAIFDLGHASAASVGLFGPLAWPPNFLLSTYTFRDRLVLTSGFCDSAVDARLVERALDLFTAELPGSPAAVPVAAHEA